MHKYQGNRNNEDNYRYRKKRFGMQEITDSLRQRAILPSNGKAYSTVTDFAKFRG
jgi:hypothetical protein